MIVRDAAPGDEAAVRRMVTAAFGRSAEAALVEALRESGEAVISLVAEEEGIVFGHILFSRLRAPERCLALAPLSVAPERQTRGIGSQLVLDGLARARRDGWAAVFLVGEPGYYERFGFRAAVAERFETAYPKAYVLALELVPDGLEGRAGALIFASPFLALE
jgi:putative acetyltransferase